MDEEVLFLAYPLLSSASPRFLEKEARDWRKRGKMPSQATWENSSCRDSEETSSVFASAPDCLHVLVDSVRYCLMII